MNGIFSKVVKIAKEEAAGLPMAVLTIVVVYGIVRFVRAKLNAKTPGQGDKLASYFSI